MFRFMFVVFTLMSFLTLAHAEDLSVSDKSAIISTVGGQLEAFAVDDGPKAYSYAAPIVTTGFPTVEIFMGMVKRGYQPLYHNSKYGFGALTTDSLGRPAQHVFVTAEGKRYEAIYSMEKQADGSWKIAGVQMVEVAATEV